VGASGQPARTAARIVLHAEEMQKRRLLCSALIGQRWRMSSDSLVVVFMALATALMSEGAVYAATVVLLDHLCLHISA
jgi:hypothetical protein